MKSLYPFFGLRVLVIEDGFIMPDELAHRLLEWGCDVIGPATNVMTAHYLSNVPDIDGALFDMHLGQEMVFPIATKLLARDIPFLFLTSDSMPSISPKEFRGVPQLSKPVDPVALKAAMAETFALRSWKMVRTRSVAF